MAKVCSYPGQDFRALRLRAQDLGLGYVGLVVLLCFIDWGCGVMEYDGHVWMTCSKTARTVKVH